jgi:ABC-type sugar transport system ATPase subunit
MTMASRIVLMHKGLIQQVGTPDQVYSTPANTFVATFVGSPPMNLFPGRIESAGGTRVFRGAFDLPLEGLAPDTLADGVSTLGIRPERVHVVGPQTPRALEVAVELVERVGPDSFVLAHLTGGAPLTVRVDAASPIREGDKICVQLPPAHLRLFDAGGNLVAKEGS